jgi:Bacterial regulatory protein, Fis family
VTDSDRITLADKVLSGHLSLNEAVARLENYLIAQAMREHSYVVTDAAHSLKLGRSTLSMLLRSKFNWKSSAKVVERKGSHICTQCKNYYTDRTCGACRKFEDAMNFKALLRGISEYGR